MPSDLVLRNSSAPNEVANEATVSAIKSLFAVIPYVGGLLDEVVFEARGRLKQQRVNQLVEALAESVRRLDEAAIDHGFIASEEFSDLVEDVVRRAAQTRGDARREAFQTVLLNAVQGKSDPDFAALFAGFLSEISEAEIALLHRFGPLPSAPDHDLGGGSTAARQFSYEEPFWGCEPAVARQIVQALVSRGLLADTSFGRYGGSQRLKFIEPTELGTRFRSWLTATS